MTNKPQDLASSIRVNLAALARARGDDMQFVLIRYANERLLARLAASPHASRFVLKGAALFTVWTGHPHRATKDIDFLGTGESDIGGLKKVFIDVVSTDIGADGVVFDANTVDVSSIRDQQAYGGVRVELLARIATAKIKLQVDVGFGDAVTPAAKIAAFPTLLDGPAPRLRMYPRETVVAEKLEAIVQLGMANSRMKDFYDLAVLAKLFDFDGALLTRAVRATFERRKTTLPVKLPIALTSAFMTDALKQSQWAGFVRKAGIKDAAALSEVVSAIVKFVQPVLKAAASKSTLKKQWIAGKSWT